MPFTDKTVLDVTRGKTNTICWPREHEATPTKHLPFTDKNKS